ncbi:MAG: pyridoxal phosphate-dependent aminotransferase [Firmicutes bacterium]|nr:pyridoxal phosphate-dependent aminotransferase [Bacillota bacterium]
MKLAERVGRLGTESAFSVLATVNELRARGRDIITFAIGEPDFDTPENIKDRCKQALDEGYTHYSPSFGILALREAIAAYISRTRGIPADPGEVVVTPGAKPIIFHSLLACVDPGDEVIYPNPGFPIYESMINFVGARPVPIFLDERNGFSFDVDRLRRLISPRTTFMIINSPENPTGGVLSRQDLESIAELAIEHDITVLSDEVYSRLVYDAPFESIASIPGMKERTIILDGFSKTYAMTGWRLGYGVMRPELASAVTRLVTNSESCTATFTQVAGVEALTGSQGRANEMREEFLARRNLIVSELNSIPGFRCLTPGGAFYVYPNVTEACKMLGCADSSEFQSRLLHEAGVAVLPRSAFGCRVEGETDEYVRFSYATSRENIIEGARRIREYIKGCAQS